MKKLIAAILLLTCLFALGGCSGKPDPWSLREPPELSVSAGDGAGPMAAKTCGYSWNQKLMGGMTSSVISCGEHPLYDSGGQREYTTLYTAGSAEPPVISLDFGVIPPETVTARRWPAESIGCAAGQYEDGEEAVTVDCSDSILLLPAEDGAFVYEVSARWGGVGNADYIFLTLPQAGAEA